MEEVSLSPTSDSQSPTGVYIPFDLPGCFRELDNMLPINTRKQIQTSSEANLSVHHFGLGMWMRNNWMLWSSLSRLKQHFADMGIQNADSVSSLILSSYWRYLNGQSLDLPKQIVYDKIMRDEIGNGPKPTG